MFQHPPRRGVYIDKYTESAIFIMHEPKTTSRKIT